MGALRRSDRLVLLVLGPVWLVVFALAALSVDRPVVALPYYLAFGDGAPEVAALPAWARPPAAPGDVRPGDRLLAVAGEPVVDAGRLRIASLTWAAMDPEGVVPVVFERDGARLEGQGALRGVAPRWPAVVVSLGCGLFAIGSILRLPRLRIAQVGMPAFLVTALWLGGQFGRTPGGELLAFGVRMASVTLLLPMALRALRWFPDGVPHPAAWTRWTGLFAVQGAFAVNAELGLVVAGGGADLVPKLVSGLFLAAVLTLSTQNYRRASPAGRRRFKWLILGVYLAYLPPTTVAVLSGFDPAYGRWFIPSQLATLALPAALLLGVWKQNLFDIDRALNAALVYLTLAGLGFGLLVVAVPGAAGAVASQTGLAPESARAVLSAVILLALFGAGVVVHGWLDRLVRREQRGREGDLAVLGAQLASSDKVQEIAALLAERLPALWSAAGAVVYAETPDGVEPVHAAGRLAVPADAEFPLARLRGGVPWEDDAAQLWLPLTGGARGELRLLGAVLLGPRSTGDDWSPADRAQLGAVAERAAARLVSLESAARLREARAVAEGLARERDAAARATEAKSAFLATASHDLRQPLHALGLFLGALEDRVTDPEARALLSQVRASAGSMGQTFDALLDVTRLDAGVLEPRREAGVAVGSLLEGLGRELAPIAASAGVALRVAPTSLAVETDPHLLRSILQNLVGNALRYTERGGVLVGARRRGARVRIQVWDTGPGMTPEERERLFDAWRRGAAREAHPEGVGLGLSIVQRLAALLDHPLEVASEPGRGTVFSVDAPRAAAAAPVAPEAAPAAALPRARVLVIDDDAGVRRALAAQLATWGLEVEVAAGRVDAVRCASEGPPPDAILADLQLRDGGTGVDAVAAVRAALGSDVPAVLVSAAPGGPAGEAARAAGLPLLAKPVEPARLRAALQHLLRARG